MTWKKDSIALGSQGQSHGWWTLHGVCVHDMVPPLGDSRAGQARAQVPIVILLVLAAVAVDLLTMSQFPENLSVLLPALTLIMATPHIYYSMAKATCTSLSFLIPPIWNSAAARRSRFISSTVLNSTQAPTSDRCP